MFHWKPSANFDAQMAHVGWGALIVLSVSLLISPLWAFAILLLWILPKEFVFDIAVEQDSYGDSAVDALFYIVGGLVGDIIYTIWFISVAGSSTLIR